MIHAYFHRPAATIRVAGVDSASFLQGQFTNELRQAIGSSVYGLLLDQKGRVLADAHVLKIAEEEYVVTSLFTTAAIVQQRLGNYIIADEVILTDETAETCALILWGEGWVDQLRQLLGVAPLTGRFARSGDLLVFAGRQTRGENYEILGAEKLIGELREKLITGGCVEADAGESEFVRISEGIPAVPQDIGPGDLPNEGCLDEEAISYTKGCYLGQEVMARLKNMGQVRRRLHIVHGPGAAPGVHAALFQGGRRCGEIRSRAGKDQGFVAWAMLPLINLDQTAGLSLAPNTPPTIRIQSRG